MILENAPKLCHWQRSAYFIMMTAQKIFISYTTGNFVQGINFKFYVTTIAWEIIISYTTENLVILIL